MNKRAIEKNRPGRACQPQTLNSRSIRSRISSRIRRNSAIQMSQKSFRHLTATGVSRAEKKNSLTSRHRPDTVQSPGDREPSDLRMIWHKSYVRQTCYTSQDAISLFVGSRRTDVCMVRSGLCSSQMSEGDQYTELRPTIGICLLLSIMFRFIDKLSARLHQDDLGDNCNTESYGQI